VCETERKGERREGEGKHTFSTHTRPALHFTASMRNERQRVIRVVLVSIILSFIFHFFSLFCIEREGGGRGEGERVLLFFLFLLRLPCAELEKKVGGKVGIIFISPSPFPSLHIIPFISYPALSSCYLFTSLLPRVFLLSPSRNAKSGITLWGLILSALSPLSHLHSLTPSLPPSSNTNAKNS
jgi:hypothetical protein